MFEKETFLLRHLLKQAETWLEFHRQKVLLKLCVLYSPSPELPMEEKFQSVEQKRLFRTAVSYWPRTEEEERGQSPSK